MPTDPCWGCYGNNCDECGMNTPRSLDCYDDDYEWSYEEREGLC